MYVSDWVDFFFYLSLWSLLSNINYSVIIPLHCLLHVLSNFMNLKLNIPLKFIIKSYPQYDDIWRWTIWMVIMFRWVHDGETPYHCIGVL